MMQLKTTNSDKLREAGEKMLQESTESTWDVQWECGVRTRDFSSFLKRLSTASNRVASLEWRTAPACPKSSTTLRSD